MDEYVKRAAIDFPFLNSGRIIDGELYVSLNEIYSEVKKLPAADVAPVVHGRWIMGEHWSCTCSVCGSLGIANDGKKYCPYCGARMDQEDKT